MFLIIFVIAKVGFSGSLIFYDSMMVDVTTDERMDEVSSHGYAWGYIGSCVPFVISLLLVLGGDKVGISTRIFLKCSMVGTCDNPTSEKLRTEILCGKSRLHGKGVFCQTWKKRGGIER